MKKAREFLQDAQDAFDKGSYNTCANRCYYVIRRALIAALRDDGIIRERWSHNDVKIEFAENLIKNKGLYPLEFENYIEFAYTQRIIADYHDIDVEKNLAYGVLSYTKGILRKIEEVTKL